VCPGFVRYHWRYEILKWIPGFDIKKIQIVQNEREPFHPDSSIVILSYDIAFKITQRLDQTNFKVCIVDEAQLICRIGFDGVSSLDTIPKC
jgi:SNF2 family DNA or RNA helicase